MTTKYTVHQLLSPSRFPGMSPKMASIVGYILEEKFTNPELLELCITSDGYLNDPVGGFMGDASDLERNWKNLLDVAGLNPKQRIEAQLMYKTRIRDWRQ